MSVHLMQNVGGIANRHSCAFALGCFDDCGA
jgi:hypothetical protein